MWFFPRTLQLVLNSLIRLYISDCPKMRSSILKNTWLILFRNDSVLTKMVISCLHKYEKQFQNFRGRWGWLQDKQPSHGCNQSYFLINPRVLFCSFIRQHLLYPKSLSVCCSYTLQIIQNNCGEEWKVDRVRCLCVLWALDPLYHPGLTFLVFIISLVINF